jgi:hypothetical protein
LARGIDPLSAFALPTGLVASTTLRGSAQAIAVVGSTQDTTQLTAFLATGDYGLAVVDVSQFTKPSISAQLDLAGTNTDVAVDPARGIAVVVGNAAGLHLVDVSTPTAPRLNQTIAFAAPVTNVALHDGLAYAATGSNVAVVNINTGDILQTLDLAALSGGTLTDLTFDGDTLFTMDQSRTLRAFSLAGETLTPRGSIMLGGGGGKLFVGGGVAYVGTTDTFSQGYLTVDVSNPAGLTLLSGVDAANVAGQSLAANGSGLMISTGQLAGPQGLPIFALDVTSASDPSNTGNFITRINLPGAPKDIALANGIAFVADGTSGLQIVNYRAFDTQGVAPTVTINVGALDRDPTKAGVQVVEGDVIDITPTVTDDVQVRNVELLVNGQVAANDAAYPFQFFALVPAIASGGASLTVQVRATDTGGNVALSAPVTLDVVRDTFPPVLQSTNVAEGARLFFVRSIDLTFDKTLDLAALNASGIRLVNVGADGAAGTGDDVVAPVTVDTRANGRIVSILPSALLTPGNYQLRVDPSVIVDHAGNSATAPTVLNFTIRAASDVKAASGVPAVTQAPSANPGQEIAISVPFDPATAWATFHVIDSNGSASTRDVQARRSDAATGRAFFQVPFDAVTGDTLIFSKVGNTRTNYPDADFFLQILPVVVGIDVTSVSFDGSSAQVQVTGFGLIEGNGTEYRFGTVAVADGGAGTGPDVGGRFDPALSASFDNGIAFLTVALSNGGSGPIVVKTAGGTSAPFSLGLSGITATALSGTPANGGEASANAGQAITLLGSGLTTGSDVLLRSVDDSGNARMTLLHPTAASADGTSATLVVPAFANGAFTLQMLGASGQPLLQIVPTLSGYNVVGSTTLQLIGSALVEGNASYQFAGVTVTDTAPGGAGPDVFADNGRVNLVEPVHGLGSVTVTTAGGTSAALSLNELHPGLSSLGDVAFDAASGQLWVVDANSPATISRIDMASGQVQQTIALPSASATHGFFSGLQVVPAMTLGATAVPAGSLLLFSGNPSPDRVIAIDPATGAAIATLTLAQNYDVTAGVYDAASGHLFVLDRRTNPNRIAEVNAATGAEIASFAAPFNGGWAGLAIDPIGGNLWFGSDNSRSVAEITRSGTVLRTVDLTPQGIDNNEIAGLVFDTTGKLLVASTQGVVYRVTV